MLELPLREKFAHCLAVELLVGQSRTWVASFFWVFLEQVVTCSPTGWTRDPTADGTFDPGYWGYDKNRNEPLYTTGTTTLNLNQTSCTQGLYENDYCDGGNRFSGSGNVAGFIVNSYATNNINAIDHTGSGSLYIHGNGQTLTLRNYGGSNSNQQFCGIWMHGSANVWVDMKDNSPMEIVSSGNRLYGIIANAGHIHIYPNSWIKLDNSGRSISDGSEYLCALYQSSSGGHVYTKTGGNITIVGKTNIGTPKHQARGILMESAAGVLDLQGGVYIGTGPRETASPFNLGICLEIKTSNEVKLSGAAFVRANQAKTAVITGNSGTVSISSGYYTAWGDANATAN